jgi:hypothetical protein
MIRSYSGAFVIMSEPVNLIAHELRALQALNTPAALALYQQFCRSLDRSEGQADPECLAAKLADYLSQAETGIEKLNSTILRDIQEAICDTDDATLVRQLCRLVSSLLGQALYHPAYTQTEMVTRLRCNNRAWIIHVWLNACQGRTTRLLRPVQGTHGEPLLDDAAVGGIALSAFTKRENDESAVREVIEHIAQTIGLSPYAADSSETFDNYCAKLNRRIRVSRGRELHYFAHQLQEQALPEVVQDQLLTYLPGLQLFLCTTDNTDQPPLSAIDDQDLEECVAAMLFELQQRQHQPTSHTQPVTGATMSGDTYNVQVLGGDVGGIGKQATGTVNQAATDTDAFAACIQALLHELRGTQQDQWQLRQTLREIQSALQNNQAPPKNARNWLQSHLLPAVDLGDKVTGLLTQLLQLWPQDFCS